MIRRKIKECFLQLEKKTPASKEPRRKTKFQGVNSEFYKASNKLYGFEDKGIQRVLSYRLLRSKVSTRMGSPVILPDIRASSPFVREKTLNCKKQSSQSSKKHLKRDLGNSEYIITGSPIWHNRTSKH